MATRGIDIRQSTDRLVFRVSLKDADGAKVTTGTTELRVYRVEDDGTLDVYDWTTDDFVATGSGTPDDETTMTHRQRRDSSGADVDTGIWTAVLSTLTNWTSGQIYIAQVTNSGAVPESQEREFQFGGVEGAQFSTATTDLNLAADAILVRDWTSVSGTPPDRCTLQALRRLRNKWAVTAGTPPTLDVYEEDDTTIAFSTDLDTDPTGEPVTGETPSA